MLTATNTENKPKPYPKLMQVKGKIVLFVSHGTGTVVVASSDDQKIGYHSNDWAMGDFYPYYGDVIITAS